jgi:DNA repair protein RecO (recombination protein O)
MNGQETEAVILSTQDIGESDRLISFYARYGGRLRGMAKGARRSRRRFVNVFEPCSLVELTFREKRSMVWIEACKLLDPHLALRQDLGRWACGSLIIELILGLVPEAETQEELFQLLKQSIWQTAEGRFPLNAVLLFVFRFMDNMGYMPAISHCMVCGTKLGEDIRWGWDPTRGVLLCSAHLKESSELLLVDLGTLLLIERVRSLPLDSIWRLQFAAVKRWGLLRSLVGWVSHHTGKGFSSMRVLDQIQWE